MNRRLLLAALTASLVLPAGAMAQAYPTKPITVIVPFAAGGPTDALARVLGQRMGEASGQQLVIENVGGAGGTIGVAKAARATRLQRLSPSSTKLWWQDLAMRRFAHG
jgi:tripartite-type tricarboxylate transporter receptor subunit TctC